MSLQRFRAQAARLLLLPITAIQRLSGSEGAADANAAATCQSGASVGLRRPALIWTRALG